MPTINRRTLLQLSGLYSASWLTSTAHLLAKADEANRTGGPAQSLIVLWMQGGPSQLETFDPQPGTKIGGQTKAIATSARDIQLADGLEQLADQMHHVSLVRSVVSKEGDHERGTYLLKTGYRPDPTLVHPSIGAICCHELPHGNTEIPRHVSILANNWSARGGYLGDGYDAFRLGDPLQKVPDVLSPIAQERYEKRLQGLALLEGTFAQGRTQSAQATLHAQTVANARRMMTTEQLKAFDVTEVPEAARLRYGDTPFGRGCLAAVRLIEQGVRCVEITLQGWDTHADNHAGSMTQKQILDPAFAALLADLHDRDLLTRTVVLCCGEFGRTPIINRLGGRDHWPHGFSVALAGGGIAGGQVIGQTDPEGGQKAADPRQVADIHATVLKTLGLDPVKEIISPIGRPFKLSEGTPIRELLAKI
jgi:hypothetical protein